MRSKAQEKEYMKFLEDYNEMYVEGMERPEIVKRLAKRYKITERQVYYRIEKVEEGVKYDL